MNTLSLAALPLIAFCACVRKGVLRVLQIEGGLLALVGAQEAPVAWLNSAIHPDEQAAFLTPPSGESRHLVRLRIGDGSWRWFCLRIGQTEHSGQDDAELSYTALLTDASEFKAMEETAQRYRDYTEITSDWYWEMDDAFRFTYFSREFEEISGVSSASALGKTRWDGLGKGAVGNLDWEAHKQAMFDHQPIRDFEYSSRRPDGRLVWFRVSGRPRHDDGGKFIGYYGIASDISATRRIEERLQQSERLASIGQLAAGVAHEINNPVGFVRSNIETLGGYLNTLLELVERYAAAEVAGAPAEALAALQAEKGRADLDFLRDDAPMLVDECRDGLDRIRKIVADLREFSREGEADLCEADLNACLESAINLTASSLPKTIQLKRDYAILPALHCRPLQLNQVFLALLANARQAIGEQAGCITVSSGQSGNGEQWVQVSDTGCGIAAEHLPRIFEPFFTTRPVGKGTGMGLAMCFGIVADHGGRIEVHSAPGAGASFRVVLPPAPVITSLK
ncbi:MAG: PAS domain S-box protein [Burkholderiaceae bacterium]|nr:PAS domain S-box protein [Burkholderiaceae bacterium]